MKMNVSYPNLFPKSHFQTLHGITVGVCPDGQKTALNLEKSALRPGNDSLHCQTNVVHYSKNTSKSQISAKLAFPPKWY